MKLTRIDIHGFKSFYRKTVIVFDRGITAIVGPNGCGKSNIVDAIKWVMGEQGARNLRGNAMEDVIFAGTKQKGPLGFCEVKLTFEGTEHLPVSTRWPHGPTLCVERRLERGKGSDYFINRKRCRLSDIQEVLAGTGVGVGQGGRRAYAIIEQGQIDQVVSARADERRYLIEEAAGVTRYRQQRRVAERKLSQTDQNLQRVADIVSEVERQLRGLKRQAKKAERFRDYRAEATRIGIRQCGVDLRKLKADIDRSKAGLKTLVTASDTERVGLEALLSNGAALDMKRREAAERLSSAAQTLSTFEEDAKLTRERLAGAAREQGIVIEQIERAKTDLESGESQLSVLEAERQSVQVSVSSIETEVAEEKVALKLAQEEEKNASLMYLEARSELERCFRREAEQKHEVTMQQYRIRTGEERYKQALSRFEHLSNEQDLQPRINSESVALATLAEEKMKVDAAVERLERERASTHDWARAFNARHDNLKRDFQRVQSELMRAETRCQSLIQLQTGAEMWGKGVDLLLNRPGIIGPIIEQFSSDAKDQRGGLAALDRAAEALVVVNFEKAMAYVQEASREEVAVSLVLEQVEWSTDDSLKEHSLETCTLAHQELAQRLFSGIMIVDDLSDAPSCFDREPNLNVVVSRDGHSVSRAGVLRTWGKSVVDEVLGRKSKIEALKTEVDRLGSALSAIEGRLVQTEHAAQEGMKQNRLTNEAYGEARIAAGEIKGRHRQAVESLERINAYAKRIEREHAEIKRVLESSQSDVELARAAFELAAQNLSDFSEEIALATEGRRFAEEAKDKLVMSTQSRRARVVGLDERLSSLKSTLSRLTRQEAEVTVRRTRFDEMSKSSSSRLDALRQRVGEDEKRLKSAEHSALDWAGKLSAFKSEHTKYEDELRLAQGKIEQRRSRIDHVRERKNTAALQVESGELRITALAERIRDRFNLSLQELAIQCVDVQEVGDEERARLRELEHLLEKLGDVNLSAIEEFEAISERHEFLIAQQADLVEAVSDLTEAMQRIDETSKALFIEAFERINELFQGLFPRLFKGGEGRLSLTNPDDLLTTGIEIHCQPPGKRLQSVDLMSGGEKAMCALALIFAVFRFRPSPFCLLDEVDAPLDDVNIGRFNEVVRALSGSSQVVLVTHNKRTMEIADSLYGVTMEESGVSKLVGVQLA
jgi:chromosome segregation protein